MNSALNACPSSLSPGHHPPGRCDQAPRLNVRDSALPCWVLRGLGSTSSSFLLTRQQHRGRGAAVEALRLQRDARCAVKPGDVQLADVSSILVSLLGVRSIAEEAVDDQQRLAATKADVAKVIESLHSQQPAQWQDPANLADLIIACEALGLPWGHLLIEPDTVLGAQELARLSDRQLTQLALACCERCAGSKFTTSLLTYLASPGAPTLSPAEALAVLETLLHHHKRLPANLISQLARRSAHSFVDRVQDLAADEVALVLAVLGVCGVRKVKKQLLWGLADRVGSTLPAADGRSISRALVGLARIGWQPPMLVQQVVSHLNQQPARLQQFSTPDLVHLLWALAQLNSSGATTLNLIKTSSILLLISHTASAGPSLTLIPPTSSVPQTVLAEPLSQALPPAPTPTTFSAFQAAALQLASSIMTAASSMTKPTTASSGPLSPAPTSPVTPPPNAQASSTTQPDASSQPTATQVADTEPAVKEAFRRGLSAQELSVIAWACVRCGYTNKTLLSQVLRLLMAASPAATAAARPVPPLVVAQAVWACGQLRYWQPGLEAWVEAHLMERVVDGTVGSQNVAVVTWAMAVCGKHPSRGFVDAILGYCCQAISQFQGRELSALLWALASWGCKVPSSLQEAVITTLASRHSSLPVWDLCSVMMSLDRLVRSIPHSLLSSLEQQLLASPHPLQYRQLSWFLLCCQRKGFQPKELIPRLCSSASHFLTLVCIAELDELEPRLQQEANKLGLKITVDVRSWPLQVAALVFGLGCHAGWVMRGGGPLKDQLKEVVAKAELELLRRPSLLPADTLASVLWAMSEVQHVPHAWLQRGLHRTLRRAVPAMTFKDLSLTLLVLSKWHQQHNVGQAQAAYVQAPAINQLQGMLERSRLTVSLPSLSEDIAAPPPALTAGPALGGRQLLGSQDLKPHMLVDVASALSHLPCYNSRLLNSMAKMSLSSLSSFNGRTLSALLSALATLRHDEPGLLKTVAQVYPAYPKWRPPTLAAVQRLLSAYAKLNHQPGEYVLQASADAVARLQVCRRLQLFADGAAARTGVMRQPNNGAPLDSYDAELIWGDSAIMNAFRADEWEVVRPSSGWERMGPSATSVESESEGRADALEKNGSDTVYGNGGANGSSSYASQQDKERIVRSLQADASTSGSRGLASDGVNGKRSRRQADVSTTDSPLAAAQYISDPINVQSRLESSFAAVASGAKSSEQQTAETRTGSESASGAPAPFEPDPSNAAASQPVPATSKDVEVACTIMYYLAVMKQHTCQLSVQLSDPLIAVLEADGRMLDTCGRWVGACMALAEADGSESPFLKLSAYSRAKCTALWRLHTIRQSRPKQVYPIVRDICKVLQGLGLETQASCLTSDGATFMDISFSLTGRQMALELLVPGKNCSRNTLKLSGEGSLKRRLLQARGYHVIYLNRKAWTGMGSKWDAKLRFVRKLLVEVPGRKHLGDFDEVHIQERVRAAPDDVVVAGVGTSGDEASAAATGTSVRGRSPMRGEEEEAPVLKRPPSIGESRIPALKNIAAQRNAAFYQQQGLQGAGLSLPQGASLVDSRPDLMMPKARQMQSALSAGM